MDSKLSLSLTLILMVVTLTTTQEDLAPTEAVLGVYCDEDGDCTLQNSYCDKTSYRCHCRDNYYPSENKTICIANAQKLRGYCERNIGCKLISNTECRKNHCKCRRGFINENEKCMLISYNCIYYHDCEKNLTGRVCENNECSCEENTGYMEPSFVRYRCAPYAKRLNEDKCLHNHGCKMLQNSRCTREPSKNECICKRGYTEKENKCLADIDGSCTETSYCNVNNSFCNNWQQCECKHGYFPLNDKKNCIKYELDGPCDHYNSCGSLSHAECVDGTCQCVKGFWEIENLCISSKDIRKNTVDSSVGKASYPCKKCTCIPTSYRIPKHCDKVTNECTDEHDVTIVRMRCPSLADSPCQDPNKCKNHL